MVDDFLLVEDGNRSADVEDLSAVNNKKQKVNLVNILIQRSTPVFQPVMKEMRSEFPTLPHPPVISIAETEGTGCQPIEIEFHIKSKLTRDLKVIFKTTEHPRWKSNKQHSISRNSSILHVHVHIYSIPNVLYVVNSIS